MSRSPINTTDCSVAGSQILDVSLQPGQSAFVAEFQMAQLLADRDSRNLRFTLELEQLQQSNRVPDLENLVPQNSEQPPQATSSATKPALRGPIAGPFTFDLAIPPPHDQ